MAGGSATTSHCAAPCSKLRSRSSSPGRSTTRPEAPGLAEAALGLAVGDGTAEADARIARVLWNDPATGVMRHADAGYPEAVACAREHGLRLPGILG